MLTKDQTRRTFYISFVNLMGGLMAAAMAVPAALYLAIRPKSAEDSNWVEVADFTQLKLNTPTEVLYTRKRVDGWQKVTEKSSAWVVKTEDRNVVAYMPACTHLACPYHWEGQANKFVCPCHGSEFSLDGKVLMGPASRPLDRFLTKVEGGKVMIGSQVEKGQAGMRGILQGIFQWIDERTGLIAGIRYFLDEEIPASSGWHQVFGSVALFAFLMQVFSGLLLAVNYAPTPGEAWESLRYIVTQVTAGSVIRAMHHWGASAMIIVVVIHMVQAFLWGAYKKPREATWIVGVVLLLLTLAFGLTGYLLVWDNRAYWGTVVTTQITGLAPGGALLLRILGTDGTSIGRVTFARFYASHVTLLPLVAALLIGFHVYLVRKHGITPVPGDENRPRKRFFPEQVFKDTVGMFIWFAAVAVMVALVKVPLGPAADPTDTSFIPRPEWYFLFLFQALKLFQGPLEVFGAVVLPGIAMALLTMAPFLDRGKLVQITRRGGAIALTVLALIGWTGLTARAVATTPKQVEEDGTVEVQSWQRIPASQLAGIGAFRKGNCGGCHMTGRSGAGPDLAKAVSAKPVDWLMEHFRKPAEDSPNPDLSDAQLRALVQLVTKRGDDGLDAWMKAPENALQGAVVYQKSQCAGCHTLNGEGGKTGPVLNGLHLRHDRTWVRDHFVDPEKLSPGSAMPPFDDLPAQDLDALTDYVMSIPK